MATPAVDVLIRDQIESVVPELVVGTNLFAGPRRSYAKGRIPHKAVFCLASGGSPSRQIKGGSDERHPRVVLRVRSDPGSVKGSLPDGQQLARDVFDAVHFNPPSGVCESVATDSQPAYEGEDDDGHHEWLIFVDVTVDVP